MNAALDMWLKLRPFGLRAVPFTAVIVCLYLLVAYYLFLPLEYGIGSGGQIFTSVSGSEISNNAALGIISLTLILLGAMLFGLTQIFSLFRPR